MIQVLTTAWPTPPTGCPPPFTGFPAPVLTCTGDPGVGTRWHLSWNQFKDSDGKSRPKILFKYSKPLTHCPSTAVSCGASFSDSSNTTSYDNSQSHHHQARHSDYRRLRHSLGWAHHPRDSRSHQGSRQSILRRLRPRHRGLHRGKHTQRDHL